MSGCWGTRDSGGTGVSGRGSPSPSPTVHTTFPFSSDSPLPTSPHCSHTGDLPDCTPRVQKKKSPPSMGSGNGMNRFMRCTGDRVCRQLRFLWAPWLVWLRPVLHNRAFCLQHPPGQQQAPAKNSQIAGQLHGQSRRVGFPLPSLGGGSTAPNSYSRCFLT